ncbi:unnamed protein product [Anisakis simplex]|uniref:FBA_1 domain-containing protein n=1 Tax=Anisakis simplex TaxID=6269 RepID=A0A0M3JAV4_ANISI|nr:unnamed protein product [Anisakis simplex]
MVWDRLIIPTDTIPKSLYWQPTDCSPNNADLQQLNICAGKEKIISVILNEYDANERVFLSLNRYAEKTYSMAIYHSVDKNEINQNIGDMHEWIPIFDYPAMPTTDLVKVPAIGAGIYKFRFGNEQVSLAHSSDFISFLDPSDVCLFALFPWINKFT